MFLADQAKASLSITIEHGECAITGILHVASNNSVDEHRHPLHLKVTPNI
jgi:hypothetical protein